MNSNWIINSFFELSQIIIDDHISMSSCDSTITSFSVGMLVSFLRGVVSRWLNTVVYAYDIFYDKEVANISFFDFDVVVFFVFAAEDNPIGVLVLAYILYHAVIFQQHDIDLSPKDEVEVFDFTNGNHVAVVDDGFHAVAAHFHDAAIGVDKGDVDASNDQIVGKHAVSGEIPGRDVEPVDFCPVSGFGGDGFGGKGEGAYVGMHIDGRG